MMNPINKHTVLKTVRTTGSWSGYVAPNKVNGFHVKDGWHIGMHVFITIDRNGNYCYVSDNAQDFQELSDFINNFAYYNCNSELGKTIKFWEEN